MKKLFILSVSCMLFAPVFGQKAAKTKDKKSKNEKTTMTLDTEKKQLSYAIGRDIGSNLRLAGLDLDQDVFFAAIKHAMQDSGYMMDSRESQQVIQQYQQKKLQEAEAESAKLAVAQEAEAQAFLANNRSAEGVKETASGLQYKVVTEGTGARPQASSRVKVHYSGTLIDGTKFDSSYDRGQPATFGLNQVIKGWTEGLQLMPEGSKYILYIPAQLGYGNNPPPGSPIKAGSLLIFEVELLEIMK